MYCKLIDAIATPQTLNLARTKDYGGRKVASYTPVRFLPGEKYEVPDDDLFLQSILNCKKLENYTPEKEAALKGCGCSYEVKMCRSCGGRRKKIEYNVLEVIA